MLRTQRKNARNVHFVPTKHLEKGQVLKSHKLNGSEKQKLWNLAIKMSKKSGSSKPASYVWPTFDINRCLDSVLRVMASAHASKLTSDIGEEGNLQTSLQRIERKTSGKFDMNRHRMISLSQ